MNGLPLMLRSCADYDVIIYALVVVLFVAFFYRDL